MDPRNAECAVGSRVAAYQAEGTVEDDVGSFHGTAFGGVGYADGFRGTAFSLDGVDDYVAIPGDTFSLDGGTVSFHFEWDGPIGAKHAFAGGVFSDGGYRRSPTFYTGTQGELLFEIGDHYGFATGVTLETGRWYHAAMTWRLNAAGLHDYEVFVDGELVRQGTAGRLGFTSRYTIGAYDWGGPRFHTAGRIDGFEIFDAALPAEQVRAVYQRGYITANYAGDGTPMNGVPGPSATLNNATYGDGLIGQAFEVDGSGWIGVPRDVFSEAAGTIAMRARWAPRGQPYDVLFGSVLGSSSGYRRAPGMIVDSTGGLSYEIGGHFGRLTGVVLTPNQWFSAALAWETEAGQVTYRVYVDGDLVGDSVTSPIAFPAWFPLGAYFQDNAYGANAAAAFDDVTVYGRALDGESIRLLHADRSDADRDQITNACDPCPLDRFNDVDGDGLCGDVDNCPAVSNPDQVDLDDDGLGDVCDPCPYDVDDDGDLVCGDVDNCPFVANPDQGDADGDGQGDLCDPCPADPGNDVDGDGVCGDVDICPVDFDPEQLDADADLLGDACDPCPDDAVADVDGDGFCSDDVCPNVWDDQADVDADQIGDACDVCPDDPGNDVDEDQICALEDNCPDAWNRYQEDLDGDGLGDVCDEDRDGDEIPNVEDNCPDLSNPGQIDTDGDGAGDLCDGDDDNDGWADAEDNCPLVPNDQSDRNQNGVGDACDTGARTCGDGVCDPGGREPETCVSCPQDCVCGTGCNLDGVCDPEESCFSCPGDCGEPLPTGTCRPLPGGPGRRP